MANPSPPPDPLYASSLRELKWILCIWSVAIVWVIGYCRWFGYPNESAPIETVWGMPAWVFWGVMVPWIVATVVSCWFAVTQMEDHSLEQLASHETAAATEDSLDGDSTNTEGSEGG